MTPTDDGNKASYGTVADEELGELQTPSGSRRWPSRVALITIAMSLIVFATGIGTAKLRKGANFGGVGCTCGEYHAVFSRPDLLQVRRVGLVDAVHRQPIRYVWVSLNKVWGNGVNCTSVVE